MSDSSLPFMVGTLADRFGSFSSAASLDSNDKYVIAQLKQQVKELNNVIALQSAAEQELNKRLQYLESSRSKGEINYEYIKNVFLKYLTFKDNKIEDANLLRDILLDLLKVSKHERESLEKENDNKGFWKLFYKSDIKNGVLPVYKSTQLIRPGPKLLTEAIEKIHDERIEEESVE